MAIMFMLRDLAKAIEEEQAETTFLAKAGLLAVQRHYGGYEDTFWFFRGAKSNFQDSSHFWLSCLLHQIVYLTPEAEKVHRILFSIKADFPDHYEEISPDTFQDIMQEYSGFLTTRSIEHLYEWNGNVYRAMKLCDEWNDVTIVGETESEFVAFRWETSA